MGTTENAAREIDAAVVDDQFIGERLRMIGPQVMQDLIEAMEGGQYFNPSPTTRRYLTAALKRAHETRPTKDNMGEATLDPSFTELLSAFANLENRRIQLEAELKMVANETLHLTGKPDGDPGPLLEQWRQYGGAAMTLHGRTVYMTNARWMFRKKPPEGVAEQLWKRQALTALRRAGLGSFINNSANAQSLRSWLKEREAEVESNAKMKQAIPAGLARYFEAQDRSQITSRRAPRKK